MEILSKEKRKFVYLTPLISETQSSALAIIKIVFAVLNKIYLLNYLSYLEL